MAKQFSGSTRTVSFNGVAYGIAADADINSVLSKWEKEVMMTSGAPMIKRTLVNQSKKGIDLLANGDEKEELKDLADSIDPIKTVITDAAENEYHCSATIMLGESTSQDNKVPVEVYPLDGDWTFVSG